MTDESETTRRARRVLERVLVVIRALSAMESPEVVDEVRRLALEEGGELGDERAGRRPALPFPDELLEIAVREAAYPLERRIAELEREVRRRSDDERGSSSSDK